MKSFGIIGYGHFGKFLAGKLGEHFELKVYSHSGKPNPWASSLEEVAASDYLILSVPLTKHKEVCEKIKPLLKDTTVIVDVCSVKEESGFIIRKALPNHRLLSTHPLFGPESAAESLKDHVIVLCPDVSDKDVLKDAAAFCQKLGLKTVLMSAKEHDREIALVQGLTFFVARILKDFKLEETQLVTPSFRKLIALAELEKQHTKDLFITIQRGNPYTDDLRKHFIARAEELQNLLSREEIPE